jgi:hypothetical protein
LQPLPASRMIRKTYKKIKSMCGSFVYAKKKSAPVHIFNSFDSQIALSSLFVRLALVVKRGRKEMDKQIN